MIQVLLLFLSIVLFELFALLKMGANARTIVSSSREAARVLASAELDDEEKESVMRRGSLSIFKATLGLALKFLVAGAVLYALFLLIVAIFPEHRQPLLASFVSPGTIAILTLAVMGYAWIRKATIKRRRAAPSGS